MGLNMAIQQSLPALQGARFGCNNPVIAHFFQQIGRVDELGSGTRKLMKYGKLFGGSDPELIEDDVFRIIEYTIPDNPKSRLQKYRLAVLVKAAALCPHGTPSCSPEYRRRKLTRVGG